MLLCPRRQSNQNAAGGYVPMNTSPQAGVHSLLPPDPRFTGDALLGNWHLRPAGKSGRMVLLAPGTQAPAGVKFEKSCAVRTPPTLAKPWQLGSC